MRGKLVGRIGHRLALQFGYQLVLSTRTRKCSSSPVSYHDWDTSPSARMFLKRESRTS